MRSSANVPLQWGALEFEVQLCKATDDVEVKLERAVKGSGVYAPVPKAIAYKPADDEEIVKGKWVNDTEFVEIPKDKLEAIDLQTQPEVAEIVGFMPSEEVPVKRIEGAHIVQGKKGTDLRPLALLHEGMIENHAVGVVKFGIRTRQRVGILVPYDDYLILLSMSYHEEWKPVDEVAMAHTSKAIKSEIDSEERDIASQLIAEQTIDNVTLDSIVDERIKLRQELVDDALAGRTIEKPKPAKSIFAAKADLKSRLKAGLK